MKISVITPLYHGQGYIGKLLKMMEMNAESIGFAEMQNQSAVRNEVEYIMVNDSPENPVLLEDLKETVSCPNLTVRMIENDKNRGIHYSRVRGLRESTGEYIMFLDQDDEITPDCLKVLLKSLTENATTDVAVSNGYRKSMQNQKSVLCPLYKKKSAMRLITRERTYLYGTDMIFSPGQCLIKRTSIPQEWEQHILTKNGCDDFLLWLLMFHKGSTMTTIWEKTYYHTETSENYSNSSENMDESYYAVCGILENIHGYEATKVNVLKRRQQFKRCQKSQKSVVGKLISAGRNLDIVCATLNYKIRGYH